MDSYKARKEAFVSNNAGDTVLRINTICWTALATYHLWKCAMPLIPARARHAWVLFFMDFAILAVPMLLAVTVLANHPLKLITCLYMCVCICCLSRPKVSSNSKTQDLQKGRATAFSKQVRGQTHSRTPSLDVESSGSDSPTKKRSMLPIGPLPASLFHKSFVTVWRAHMMLMTVLCILAVDFPAFPRSFGKCEAFGTSLMDIGVGSFVFSLGLVSAVPFLRNLRLPEKQYKPLQPLRRNAIVLAIGLARILMVKGSDYPEHVTEYGVHWNFFFTLGLLPLFGTIAERMWYHASFRTQALAVTLVHQSLLSFTQLQGFTLGSDRSNILSQNKEGLASFAGYLAIYLLGMDTGAYVLPPDPYFAYRSKNKPSLLVPKPDKLISVLFSYAVVWWSAFGVFHMLLPPRYAVSRVLANTAYVLWVTAFNVTFLLLYLVHDRWVGSNEPTEEAAPALFQALNRNGLVVFLVANLLTGLVNLSITTMDVSDTTALVILLLYLLSTLSLAHLLRNYRLKL